MKQSDGRLHQWCNVRRIGCKTPDRLNNKREMNIPRDWNPNSQLYHIQHFFNCFPTSFYYFSLHKFLFFSLPVFNHDPCTRQHFFKFFPTSFYYSSLYMFLFFPLPVSNHDSCTIPAVNLVTFLYCLTLPSTSGSSSCKPALLHGLIYLLRIWIGYNSSL